MVQIMQKVTGARMVQPITSSAFQSMWMPGHLAILSCERIRYIADDDWLLVWLLDPSAATMGDILSPSSLLSKFCLKKQLSFLHCNMHNRERLSIPVPIVWFIRFKLKANSSLSWKFILCKSYLKVPVSE